jgi:hypothetical protein
VPKAASWAVTGALPNSSAAAAEPPAASAREIEAQSIGPRMPRPTHCDQIGRQDLSRRLRRDIVVGKDQEIDRCL